jgi:hypothetical protein
MKDSGDEVAAYRAWIGAGVVETPSHSSDVA